MLILKKEYQRKQVENFCWKNFVGKIKNYQSGFDYARYMCKKIIEFLTRDIFIRKLFRFNLDIIIETEDKNFPSANKD